MGGISTGQEIVVSFAVKPTSSILKSRKTINKFGKNTNISVKGNLYWMQINFNCASKKTHDLHPKGPEVESFAISKGIKYICVNIDEKLL